MCFVKLFIARFAVEFMVAIFAVEFIVAIFAARITFDGSKHRCHVIFRRRRELVRRIRT